MDIGERLLIYVYDLKNNRRKDRLLSSRQCPYLPLFYFTPEESDRIMNLRDLNGNTMKQRFDWHYLFNNNLSPTKNNQEILKIMLDFVNYNDRFKNALNKLSQNFNGV